jgi:hypothetical protein
MHIYSAPLADNFARNAGNVCAAFQGRSGSQYAISIGVVAFGSNRAGDDFSSDIEPNRVGK